MEQLPSRLKRHTSFRRFRPHVPQSLTSTLARTESLSVSHTGSRSLKRGHTLPGMTRSPNLGISVQREPGDVSPLSSPRTPHTPGPHSPFTQNFTEGYDNQSHSPITAAPRQPSPKTKTSKSFFSNSKASRSTTKLPKAESPARQPAGSSSPGGGAMSQVYGQGRSLGSSPELGIANTGNPEHSNTAASGSIDPSAQNNANAVPMTSMNAPKKKQPKHKFNILGRKASIKDEESLSSKSASDKNRQTRDTRNERNFKDKATTSRNRSVDRSGFNEDDNTHLHANMNGPSLRSDIRSTGTRAADGFGRAAKGLFGKLSTRSNQGESSREAKDAAERSARDTAKDEADAQRAALTKSYKVVNLPLEEQTRTTRICKRLEDCKDKTEFWLPAVAYRCIDYLNDKGMTHEGLYRVPGSEREIRNWIWRFDKEGDIDLLGEHELYDVNTISSMFKAWLRDLPDEVFPKTIQNKITASVANPLDHKGAPEILKTELSKLPPFNYYLLFAVTAHITMLLNASKENKMSFHNLCVCFMPAMKMEMPCFSWLILDWKNCWEGCATERDFLEREYAIQERRRSEGDGDGDSEGRSRPVQHFDRYLPRNASQQIPNAPEDSTNSVRPSTSYTTKPSSGVAGLDFSMPPLPLNNTNGSRHAPSSANTSNARSETPSNMTNSSPKKSNQAWKTGDPFTSQREKPTTSTPPLNRSGSEPSVTSAKYSGAQRKQESTGEENGTSQTNRSPRHNQRPQGIAQPDRSKNHYDGNFGEMRSRSGKESKKSRSRKDSSSKFTSLAAVEQDSSKGHSLSEIDAPELSPLKPMSPFGSLSDL